MKRIISFILLVLCLTMTGCTREKPPEGIPLPFEAADVERIDAYYYLEHNEHSARKKVVTNQETIQFLCTTFHTLSISNDAVDPNKYGADISAYRFCLTNGTTYEIVYKGYGIKDGVISTQDMPPHVTAADINGLWFNLAADAQGCPKEELPVLQEEEPVAQTTAPIVYTGEEAEVHQLVQDFLNLKHTDFQSEEHLDFSPYFAPDLRDSLEEQLSWKVFRFEKLVRGSIREKLLWEKFRASVNGISIDSDTAAVTAFDVYEYELADANGSESGRGTTLIFSCQKIDGEWFITGIETDNEIIEAVVDGVPAEDLPALAGAE